MTGKAPDASKKSSTDDKTTRQLHEASTRRVWGRRTQTSSVVPPGLESVGTTEREAQHFYFERQYGNPTYSNLPDVEAQASVEEIAATDSSPDIELFKNHQDVTVTEMEIMHNWTQKIQDENLFVATINVLKDASAPRRPSGRVIWMHLETPLPSLDYIEEAFHSRIKHMLKPHLRETTVSLLNRIRTDHERQFILGRYLSTGVVRYSARSVETNNKDQPCLFLSFPFLAKGDFQQSHSRIGHKGKQNGMHPPDIQAATRNAPTQNPLPQNGAHHAMNGQGPTEKVTKRVSFHARQQIVEDVHPVRTLLQSKYRLESTSKRDKQQTILSLSGRDLQDCIQLSKSQGSVVHPAMVGRETSTQLQPLTPTRSRTQDSTLSITTKSAHRRQKLYIPQLWSLSLSGDIMLTCGPLSLDDLCGSELTRNDYTSSRSRHRVVRFKVENDFGKTEEFIYPADRCDWYFGLLNKQRKIEDILGKKVHVQLAQKRKGTCSLFYSAVYRRNGSGTEEVVDCGNWLEIQSQHTEDYLELYLENHMLPTINPAISDADAVAQSPEDFLNPVNPAAKHVRSLSAPTSTASRPISTSPRLLLEVPIERITRNGSMSQSSTPRTRSVSPVSFSTPEDTSFFEWPFYEEINENVRYEKERRVNGWLAKVHATVCRRHLEDIHPSLLRHAQHSKSPEFVKQLRLPVTGSDTEQIHLDFFRHGPDIIQDDSTPESDAAQKIYIRAMTLIKLFIPEDICKIRLENIAQASGKLLHLYWGLILRILKGIADQRTGQDIKPKDLVNSFDVLVDLAKRVHKGVWRMKGDMNDLRDITLSDTAIISVPLVQVFEYIFDLFFTIIATMEGSMPLTATETVKFRMNAILDEFENVEDNLTQEADENRSQKGLGPIVTPEGITLLLLNRLSRSVYRHGTINVIEVYERVVERLAYKVESSSSRLLLLEINKAMEEIGIVLDTFTQQQSFLNKYKYFLNPKEIKDPSVKRQTRFVYEKVGIEKLEKDVNERMQHCIELRDRIKLLAEQNLQRVEAYQEDNNNKLMLFTVITVTFLPLSFVTSFLGMNVVGVRDTTYSVTRFWLIAVPLTVGLLALSLLYLYWNSIMGLWKVVREHFAPEEDEFLT